MTSTTSASFALEPNAAGTLASILQQDLVELVALSLQLKQAHWNVCGTQFRSVHLHLDEILATVRGAADDFAERIATLGEYPDGRPATVARDTHLEPLPEGQLESPEAITLITESLGSCIRQLREKLTTVEKIDPVSHDMVVGALAALEKQHWMLRSQRPL